MNEDKLNHIGEPQELVQLNISLEEMQLAVTSLTSPDLKLNELENRMMAARFLKDGGVTYLRLLEETAQAAKDIRAMYDETAMICSKEVA